jgi:putative CocE/NonD family hydrolase
MTITAGARDQRSVQALPNYGLIYTSTPLQEDLTIAGTVEVTVQLQSDCPDTDVIAKLVDLHPDGRAVLLMDGVQRVMYRDGAAAPRHLSPDEVVPVSVTLGDIHHTFPAGNRLELDITSSNFPRRVRNTNSGNPLLAGDSAADIRIATNVVHHGGAEPSFVVLPVWRG